MIYLSCYIYHSFKVRTHNAYVSSIWCILKCFVRHISCCNFNCIYYVLHINCWDSTAYVPCFFSVFVFKRSPLMDCQNCIWMYLINCHYYLFNEGYIIVSCLFLDVFYDNMAAFLELLCIDLQLLCHIKYCTCNIYIFIEHITGPFDHLHFWLRRWSV